MIFLILLIRLLSKTSPITNVKNTKKSFFYNNVLTLKTRNLEISSKALKSFFNKSLHKDESLWRLLLKNYNFKSNDYLFFVSLGIERCPTSEYLWFKYIRNVPYNIYKFNILKSVKILPTNDKLWTIIINKCDNEKEKQKLLLKSLKNIPSSDVLWKLFLKHTPVNLYIPALYKAVSCRPDDLELWQLLINTKNYFDSKKILNIARKINPKKIEIWIMAACLEEIYGFIKNSYKVIRKCFIYYRNKSDVVDLELFSLVVKREKIQAKFFYTFKTIIKFVIVKNVKRNFFLRKWINKLQELDLKTNPLVIEQTLKNICVVFPNNYALILYLLSYFVYVKKIKKFEDLLENCLSINLNLEILWLIIFNYCYKKFDNINTSIFFKKFYIKKYYVNFIISYLTNIFKYREIIKFFLILRIFIIRYPIIKNYIKNRKIHTNFIINNFAELNFGKDKVTNYVIKDLYYPISSFYSKYMFVAASFIDQKKPIVDLLYDYKKTNRDIIICDKTISVILYKKKIKCLNFLNYIFFSLKKVNKNKSTMIDYFKKNFNENVAFSITIELLETYNNSFKLWKGIISLGRDKIDKLIFILLFENLLDINDVLKIIAKFLWISMNYIKSRKLFLKTMSYYKSSITTVINILILEQSIFRYKNSNMLIKVTKAMVFHLLTIKYILFSQDVLNQFSSRILYYFSVYLLKNKLKM